MSALLKKKEMRKHNTSGSEDGTGTPASGQIEETK